MREEATQPEAVPETDPAPSPEAETAEIPADGNPTAATETDLPTSKARSFRPLPPLVKYGAVLLLGGGIVAGALALPILGQAGTISAQTATIAARDGEIAKEKLATQGCSFAAGLYKQAADEYLLAAQSTADALGKVFGNYSAELAATRTHAGAANTAYGTAATLGCDTGITVSK